MAYCRTIAMLSDYFIPRLFPFNWGNSIAGNPYMLQAADIVSIYGLTFLVFAISYFFYRLFIIFTRIFIRQGSGKDAIIALLNDLKRAYVWKRLFPVPLILILCFGYGMVRKCQVETLQESLPKVRVAVINPNAPPEDSDIVDAHVLKKLISKTIPSLVEKAAAASRGRLDLVVLPESAVPFLCTDNTVLNNREKLYSPSFEKMAQLIAYNYNVDVFLNETVTRARENCSGKMCEETFNSSVLYSREGERRDSYDKRRLLAFGEYVPGMDFLKATGLIHLAPGIEGSSRFSAGKRSNLISYSQLNRKEENIIPQPLSLDMLIGKSPEEFKREFPEGRKFSADGYFIPLICYEVLFHDHVRSFFKNSGKKKPGFIVNITQDGWYGDTTETYQHYDLARIRAVETRRALVRAVNNGAAGFVDIAGNFVTPLPGR